MCTSATSYVYVCYFLCVRLLLFTGLKPDFLPLNRPQVMTSVVSIICEHIAQDLVALNLSNNRLSSLVHLEKAVSSTPNLQGLDLSNNPEVHSLESIDSYSIYFKFGRIQLLHSGMAAVTVEFSSCCPLVLLVFKS